jgi:hypothetical protein
MPPACSTYVLNRHSLTAPFRINEPKQQQMLMGLFWLIPVLQLCLLVAFKHNTALMMLNVLNEFLLILLVVTVIRIVCRLLCHMCCLPPEQQNPEHNSDCQHQHQHPTAEPTVQPFAHVPSQPAESMTVRAQKRSKIAFGLCNFFMWMSFIACIYTLFLYVSEGVEASTIFINFAWVLIMNVFIEVVELMFLFYFLDCCCRWCCCCCCQPPLLASTSSERAYLLA